TSCVKVSRFLSPHIAQFELVKIILTTGRARNALHQYRSFDWLLQSHHLCKEQPALFRLDHQFDGSLF
ncbi:MAG: hypothetical protein VXB67_15520, partial [Deltaproteobacteria bacterium]